MFKIQGGTLKLGPFEFLEESNAIVRLLVSRTFWVKLLSVCFFLPYQKKALKTL